MEERVITTKEEELGQICSLLGGRAAEELFVGAISTGAMNDLEAFHQGRVRNGGLHRHERQAAKHLLL